MRKDFKFYRPNGSPTQDYLNGTPMIPILIEVGVTLPDDESKGYQLNQERHMALIDTGSNHTMISSRLAANKTPLGPAAPIQTGMGVITGRQFLSIVTIEGFTRQCPAFSGEMTNLTDFDVILGRDVLSFYNLFYKPLTPEFYIEGDQ